MTSSSSKLIRTFTLGLVLLSMSTHLTAQGPIIRFVDASATGAGNGLTWQDAYVSLAFALDDTLSRVTPSPTTPLQIWVAEGVYRAERPGVALPYTLELRSHTQWYGGFPQGGAASLTARDPALHPTILDGMLSQPGVGMQNRATHVITAIDAVGAVVDGFTVRNGRAYPPQPGVSAPVNRKGGGLLVVGLTSNVSVRSAVFRDNEADTRGGAIAVESGFCHVFDSEFTNNTTTSPSSSAQGSGGAAHAFEFGRLDLTRCQFNSNTAASSSGNGGAVHYARQPGSVPASLLGGVITSSSFTNNAAPGGNGGALAMFREGTLRGSTFAGNTARDTGGGAYLDATLTQQSGPGIPNIRVLGCTFESNVARFQGGGFNCVTLEGLVVEPWNPSGQGTPLPPVFRFNASNEGGGAIVNRGPATFEGATFDRNTGDNFPPRFSGDAGGLMLRQNGARTSIRYCAFIGNTCIDAGGALLISDGAICEIDSSLFRDNEAGNNGGAICQNDSRLVVRGSTLVNNFAATPHPTLGVLGGGYCGFNSVSAEFIGSIFWNNRGGPSQELNQVSFHSGSVRLESNFFHLEMGETLSTRFTNPPLAPGSLNNDEAIEGTGFTPGFVDFGTTVTSPTFVIGNPTAERDLRLRLTSPCLDRHGLTSGSVAWSSRDLLGRNRTTGILTDLGCYELLVPRPGTGSFYFPTGGGIRRDLQLEIESGALGHALVPAVDGQAFSDSANVATDIHRLRVSLSAQSNQFVGAPFFIGIEVLGRTVPEDPATIIPILPNGIQNLYLDLTSPSFAIVVPSPTRPIGLAGPFLSAGDNTFSFAINLAGQAPLVGAENLQIRIQAATIDPVGPSSLLLTDSLDWFISY